MMTPHDEAYLNVSARFHYLLSGIWEEHGIYSIVSESASGLLFIRIHCPSIFHERRVQYGWT
jgi:hypothetical protein